MTRTRCAAPPQSVDSDAARLLKVLGAKRLAALQAVFGGRRLWIPKSGTNLRCSVCRHRDECIRLWRSQSLSIAVIAKRLGISPKTVYRILGRRLAPTPA